MAPEQRPVPGRTQPLTVLHARGHAHALRAKIAFKKQGGEGESLIVLVQYSYIPVFAYFLVVPKTKSSLTCDLQVMSPPMILEDRPS
jgi:hypothetical protein